MRSKLLWLYMISLTLALASGGWLPGARGLAVTQGSSGAATRGRLSRTAPEPEDPQVAEKKTLAQVVAEKPYPDYQKWWPLGKRFSELMSDAIVSEWSRLEASPGRLDEVKALVSDYVQTVYHSEARPSLVEDFVEKRLEPPLQSGEFDALSYGFFRSAFERMEASAESTEAGLASRRRQFTERVGRRFFQALADDLGLDLPKGLEDERSFEKLKEAIRKVSAFFVEQGYCRDHAAFRFDVVQRHEGREIRQSESAVVSELKKKGRAYALYEMGYPAILPSAVYLFNTLGEAQHHSSRTIEELFSEVGYRAQETKDFDPTGYPSDMVVELWEIQKLH